MVYRSRGPCCPRCKRLLSELAIDAGSALGCEQCGGVMIDEAGFAAVRERLYAAILERTGAPPNIPTSDPTGALGCPQCGAAMKRTHVASVPIDLCSEHGTWFDAHELVAVAQTIADHRGLPSTKHMPEEPLPYAHSRETAKELARLQAELRSQNTSLLLTDALARLRRFRRGI